MENLLKDVVFPVERNYMPECHLLAYTATGGGLNPPPLFFIPALWVWKAGAFAAEPALIIIIIRVEKRRAACD